LNTGRVRIFGGFLEDFWRILAVILKVVKSL